MKKLLTLLLISSTCFSQDVLDLTGVAMLGGGQIVTLPNIPNETFVKVDTVYGQVKFFSKTKGEVFTRAFKIDSVFSFYVPGSCSHYNSPLSAVCAVDHIEKRQRRQTLKVAAYELARHVGHERFFSVSEIDLKKKYEFIPESEMQP